MIKIWPQSNLIWIIIIDTREYFVIKEIDTTTMTTEQSFEALEEISVQATIDSPYVVSKGLQIKILEQYSYW